MIRPGPPQAALVVLPFLDGPRSVVVLAGDADVLSASRLQSQLIGTVGQGTRSLVVDVTDLAVCDLQGADALAAAVAAVEARGVSVSLRGQSAQAAALLPAQLHSA